MKKNKFFMLGIVTVLVAVLSLTFVSSTFAKYTSSGSAEDTARVAKWGVTVSVSGNDAFKEEYDYEIGASSNTVVTSVPTETVDDVTTPGEKILAPGTQGTLGGILITGQPEVAVSLDVSLALNLTGWEIEGGVYCPIIFTVTVREWVEEDDPLTPEVDKIYKTTFDEEVKGWELEEGVYSYKAMATIEAEIEALVNDLSEASTVSPNTDLKREVTISWRWEFESSDLASAQSDLAAAEAKLNDLDDSNDDDAEAEKTAALAAIAFFEKTDANDTELGNWSLNSEPAPTISATWSANVTQVD